MSSKERLSSVFNSLQPDRTPLLGGWIAYSGHIIELANSTIDEYKSNPIEVSIKAYQNLKIDGLVDIILPTNIDGYRVVNQEDYARSEPISFEECIEQINNLPSPEQIENSFDFESEYQVFKKSLLKIQGLCGEMVYMPVQWEGGAKASWYRDFGYLNYFIIIGGYKEKAIKLMEVGGAYGRNNSRIIARAVKEGIFPNAVLLGQDICTQRGPMINPDFLEKYYAPQLRYGLEPLLEVGCKPVWHCDGDCRLILDMLLDCGIQGFQGFQPECGMNLESIVAKRTRENKPLLIFGPIAVTTELPVCTPEEIKNKVKHAVEVCRGNANLALFTSMTINPDVPIENIKAMYEAIFEDI
ncbi:MAG: hypothetical protein MUP22_09485 [Desulfobacterales bacterium]|nr:hypothetical protein [Desulfobacterales bacterium]